MSLRWHARFKPPKSQSTRIRMIPGLYKGIDGRDNAYFQYVEVYSARTQRSFVSSAQYAFDGGALTKIGGECLGWDEYMKEIQEGIDREHRSVSLRVLHAFTILHLADYHLVPVLDDAGNQRRYENGKNAGQPIFNRLLCEGKVCPHCKAGHEKVFGNKLHWSLGFGHMTELSGYVEEIEKDCANCGGSGTIETVGWACPQCHEELYHPEQFEDQEQLKKTTRAATKCNCGFVDYPEPLVMCSECADNARPLDIFDCDISVKRQGEGTQSSLQISRWKPTDLSQDLIEMATPFDFPSIFFPDPLEVQAKMLRVDNPYEGKAVEKAARPYVNFGK